MIKIMHHRQKKLKQDKKFKVWIKQFKVWIEKIKIWIKKIKVWIEKIIYYRQNKLKYG